MEKEKNEQANQWFIDSFNDSFNSIQFNSFNLFNSLHD